MPVHLPPLTSALLTAEEVAARLKVDRRRVYELPIPRVALTTKCFRWCSEDVEHFINARRKM